MKNSRYFLTGLIIAGILVAAVLLLKKNQPLPVTATVSEDSKSKGPKDALVQIVEYSDFQCPACAHAEPTIQKIMNDPDYSGKIHFVYRHFPLSGHQWSSLAHQAAECANEQGKFWDYHKKLYDDQNTWSLKENPTESLILYAKSLNLSLERFGICLANPEVHQRILKEKRKGEDLQIRSTPTFFVNGERLVGPVELEMRGVPLIRKTLGLAEKAAAVQAAISPLPVLQTPVVPAASPASLAQPLIAPSPEIVPVVSPAVPALPSSLPQPSASASPNS